MGTMKRVSMYIDAPPFTDWHTRKDMVSVGVVTRHHATGTKYSRYFCKTEDLDAARIELERMRENAAKNAHKPNIWE